MPIIHLTAYNNQVNQVLNIFACHIQINYLQKNSINKCGNFHKVVYLQVTYRWRGTLRVDADQVFLACLDHELHKGGSSRRVDGVVMPTPDKAVYKVIRDIWYAWRVTDHLF